MKKKKQLYCGAGKSALFIPDFAFTASCKKHDDYYAEGGGLIEFFKANTFFYAYMLEDISEGKYSFFRRFFYFKMATLYFIMVTLFGGFCFNWHR